MKKFIAFWAGATLCLAAAAQSWDEALLFSENQYGGTARSVAMGNAMTAIGGDPGSFTINPAGIAVSSFSQFTVTPGLTLSVAGANGNFFENFEKGTLTPRGFGDQVNSTYARMSLPNLAFTLNRDNGRRSGWKRFGGGFALNATNNFSNRFNAGGLNSLTSYAAALASSAEGYSADVLSNASWFDETDPTRRAEWVDRVGYLSGLFNGIPGYEGLYQAVTETRSESGGVVDRWVPAPLYQTYGEQTTGSKYDMVFSFAANYSDKFYVGANLGVTLLNYGMSEYWQERPDNVDEFPPIEYEGGTVARYQSLRMKRNYKLRGSGIFFKAGVLWRPVAGLRLGAAIQTPTLMSLFARNAFNGEVSLSGKSIPAYSSPEDQWEYTLTLPFRFNVGAAYSFGSIALLSADYEFVNYRGARYGLTSGEYGPMPAYMSDANLDIKDVLGVSHQLRVGAEIKPTAALAIRLGYNLITTGQRNFIDYYVDANNNVQVNLTPLTASERMAQAKHSASIGVGYAFGSFFLDGALRARFVPKEYITPYFYYAYDGDYTDKYVDDGMQVPTFMTRSTLFDAMLTLGWRF